MEYGEAISARAADKAFEIACARLAKRQGGVRQIASEAVAEAYCVCVVDGEDAAEGHLSPIHANLIDQIERRLREWLARGKES